jgi:hypothetical protein
MQVTITVFCKADEVHEVYNHYQNAFRDAEPMLYGASPVVTDATPQEAKEAEENLLDGTEDFDDEDHEELPAPNISANMATFLEVESNNCMDSGEDNTLQTALGSYQQMTPDVLADLLFDATDPARLEKQKVFDDLGTELNNLIANYGDQTRIDLFLANL